MTEVHEGELMRLASHAATIGAALAVAILAGCVAQPPAAPETTTVATEPAASSTPDGGATPSASPSPSAGTPEVSTDPGIPGSGPYLTVDGVPGGSWVNTLECTYFTPTDLQLTGDPADTSGSLVGSVSSQSGAWGSVGILLTHDDHAYFQVEEFAPATVENDRLTLQFEASGMTGETVDVELGVDCVS